MATPITHVVLTDKVFNDLFSTKDYKEFMLGTLFPDIRYVAKINRDLTHYSKLTINDALNSESFKAGMIFHNILDEIREKYLSSNGLYNCIKPTSLNIGAVKIAEDILLYENFSNWIVITNTLSSINPIEKEFSISNEVIMKWHDGLKNYISLQPNDNIIKNFALLIGGTEEQAQHLNTVVKKILLNKDILNILTGFHIEFSSLVK